MAGLLRQFPQIEQLRPSVSLAKRMHIVHVAHDPRRCVGKFHVAEPPQKLGAREPLVNVRHAGFDETAELELLAALVEFDEPDLAGPIVNVLEQMLMDRLQVIEIEIAGRDAFDDALRHQPALGAVEFGRIDDPELVPEHRRVRVCVWIAAAHSAAKRRALARR